MDFIVIGQVNPSLASATSSKMRLRDPCWVNAGWGLTFRFGGAS